NSGSGGGDEVRTVGATGGSIGYAALSDARSVYASLGGGAASPTWPNLKWIPIRNTTLLTNVDPSTNNLSATKTNSGCATTSGTYTPPSGSGATGNWSGVYVSSSTNQYPICTLTWDLAVTDYTPAWGATGTDYDQSVRDYLGYVTSSGGQADIINNDY